jgi:hypothetical protein
MRRTRRYVAMMIIVIAGLLASAGCVSVPTTGPIEQIEGQQPSCQNGCVNVQVVPPDPSAGPKEIIEGYLRATSNYQPNYAVARQFLAPMAAEKWSPEVGVRIYQGSPVVQGDTVIFKRLVGQLGPDRTYMATASEKQFKWNFGLRQGENGEWRITKPPDGLMVAEFSFKYFYQPYDLFFVGNGRSLVPDPIYLPGLSNPANVASALMKGLLNGPSKWLKPAVTSAIPPKTTLSVDSVTITDGIAEVPLSDSVAALPDPQRSLLAAQIVYTLRQVPGVKGALIKVNQQPYRVPGSDPNSLAVPIDAIPGDLDPIPSIAGEEPYAVQGRAVKQLTTASDSPTLKGLPGTLGHGKYPVDALALSVTNADFAVITDRRTTLRRAPITTGEPTTVLSGASELLRPQFTRYGELWAIGRKGGRQWIWVLSAGKKVPAPIDLPVEDVKAFKISPDGTRMALVRSTESGSELGLARIIRSDKIIVDGWRRLNATPLIDRVQDVAWLDATDLLVLGASATDTAYTPFRVVQDASRITRQGDPENWTAVELAVSPRRQTAIIIGAQGRTWKDDGSQWSPFIREQVKTIAYPG